VTSTDGDTDNPESNCAKRKRKRECEVSTGTRESGRNSTGFVRRGDVGDLVVCCYVEERNLYDGRRDSLFFLDDSLVDEVPPCGCEFRPVRVCECPSRLTIRVEVHGVSRNFFRRDELVLERVAVFVHHLVPDGEVYGGVIYRDPGCVVDVFGFSEDAVGGLGQVDGLVGRFFTSRLYDLFFVNLDPLGVDWRVFGGEVAGLRLHFGFPQVSLGVLSEVGGATRLANHGDVIFGSAEAVPTGHRFFWNPGSFLAVGRDRAVLSQVLPEGLDGVVVGLGH